uniref:Uncharacterized protein n=1 Tax=Percolomonas cosmopolitus TaxID=63605 RepID=A0A7S1PET6_9EUKA
MDFSHGIDPLERPRAKIWKSSFQNPNSRHSSLISTHPFNHSLQLLLPFTSQDQKSQLSSIISSSLSQPHKSYFYNVLRLNYRNIDAFVDVICEAISRNCVVRAMAIKGIQDPIKMAVCNAHFIMHINQSMKFRLGMPCEKIKSFYERDVWCVDVDMSKAKSVNREQDMEKANAHDDHRMMDIAKDDNTPAPDGQPSSATTTTPTSTATRTPKPTIADPRQPGLISRLKWALQRWLHETHLQIDFVLAIENQHGEPMELDLFTTHKFPLKRVQGFGDPLKLSLPKKFFLPKIRRVMNAHEQPHEKLRWEHTMKGIMNYVGIAATGAHRFLKTTNSDGKYDDPFFVHNLYGAFEPDEYVQCRGGFFVNMSGLVPPSVVQNVLNELRKHYSSLSAEDSHQDELWYSVLVTGFAESPVSWRHYNHGTCIGEENDYLLIGLSGEDESYLSFQCLNEYGSECQ